MINEAEAEIYSAQHFIEDPNFTDKIDEITKNRIETLILELMDLKVLEDAVSLKLKVKALRDAVTEAGESFY